MAYFAAGMLLQGVADKRDEIMQTRTVRPCEGGGHCMHLRRKATTGKCCKCKSEIDFDYDRNMLIKMGPKATDTTSGLRLYSVCIPCWYAWHKDWQSVACKDAECLAYFELFAARNPLRVQLTGGLGALPLAITAPPPQVQPARNASLEAMVATLQARIATLESGTVSPLTVAALEFRIAALEAGTCSSSTAVAALQAGTGSSATTVALQAGPCPASTTVDP